MTEYEEKPLVFHPGMLQDLMMEVDCSTYCTFLPSYNIIFRGLYFTKTGKRLHVPDYMYTHRICITYVTIHGIFHVFNF